MDRINTSQRPQSRISKGDALLRKAEQVDMSAVKGRLRQFAATHHKLVEAQAIVERGIIAKQAAQAYVGELDRQQDKALADLAAYLSMDGAPRDRQFEKFGAPTLGRIQSMHYAEEARAIHALVSAVQSDPATQPATRSMAQLAGAAALKVEEALATIHTARVGLKTARDHRDVLVQTWDDDYSALLHAVRAAGDREAPGVYEALFARKPRPPKKPRVKEAAPNVPLLPAPTPTPSAQPATMTE